MLNNNLADISTFESLQANTSFGNSQMNAFQTDVPIKNNIQDIQAVEKALLEYEKITKEYATSKEKTKTLKRAVEKLDIEVDTLYERGETDVNTRLKKDPNDSNALKEKQTLTAIHSRVSKAQKEANA
jgi:signal recognition particle subunit SEC65